MAQATFISKHRGKVTPMTDAFDNQARTWGMACHLSALAMFTCIPFANILGPLIVWLVKRQEIPFVDDQGKEALNFQITMAVAYIAIVILYMILRIFWALFPLLTIFDVVFIIIASIQARAGTAYRYPVSLRLVK